MTPNLWPNSLFAFIVGMVCCSAQAEPEIMSQLRHANQGIDAVEATFQITVTDYQYPAERDEEIRHYQQMLAKAGDDATRRWARGEIERLRAAGRDEVISNSTTQTWSGYIFADGRFYLTSGADAPSSAAYHYGSDGSVAYSDYRDDKSLRQRVITLGARKPKLHDNPAVPAADWVVKWMTGVNPLLSHPTVRVEKNEAGTTVVLEPNPLPEHGGRWVLRLNPPQGHGIVQEAWAVDMVTGDTLERVVHDNVREVAEDIYRPMRRTVTAYRVVDGRSVPSRETTLVFERIGAINPEPPPDMLMFNLDARPLTVIDYTQTDPTRPGGAVEYETTPLGEAVRVPLDQLNEFAARHVQADTPHRECDPESRD